VVPWDQLPEQVIKDHRWRTSDDYADFLHNALVPFVGSESAGLINTNVSRDYNSMVKDPAPWKAGHP